MSVGGMNDDRYSHSAFERYIRWGTGECGARRELADGDWATGSRRTKDTQNG